MNVPCGRHGNGTSTPIEFDDFPNCKPSDRGISQPAMFHYPQVFTKDVCDRSHVLRKIAPFDPHVSHRRLYPRRYQQRGQHFWPHPGIWDAVLLPDMWQTQQ